MREGKIKVEDEIIIGKNGFPVKVSNKTFDKLVSMPDWKGVYKRGEVDD